MYVYKLWRYYLVQGPEFYSSIFQLLQYQEQQTRKPKKKRKKKKKSNSSPETENTNHIHFDEEEFEIPLNQETENDEKHHSQHVGFDVENESQSVEDDSQFVDKQDREVLTTSSEQYTDEWTDYLSNTPESWDEYWNKYSNQLVWNDWCQKFDEMKMQFIEKKQVEGLCFVFFYILQFIVFFC